MLEVKNVFVEIKCLVDRLNIRLGIIEDRFNEWKDGFEEII